jgi:Ca2+-binding RTX toxin-like protein
MDGHARSAERRQRQRRRLHKMVALGAVPLLVSIGLQTGASGSAASVSCFGKSPTLVGTAGVDLLTGTAGADVIYAGDGDDVVHGGGGNDLICGGAGDDALLGENGVNKLQGGAGDDRLVGATTFIGGDGVYDTVLFADLPATTPVTVNLGTGAASASGVHYRLTGVEGIVGTPGNDVLTGSAGVDLLFGAGGNDRVNGGGGFDYAGFLVAAVHANLSTGKATGEGRDTLRNIQGLLAALSPSSLHGNAAANVLLGAVGNDVLHGAGGNDLIAGGTGADSLFGGGGNDRLLGQGGDDRVTGGAAYDTAAYYTAASAVSASLTTNTSSGSDGVDVLATVENLMGSEFDDTLTGDDISNLLAGMAGDDILSGSGGRDLLDGGAGTDTGDGGTGIDACRAAENPTSCETMIEATTTGAGLQARGVADLAATAAATATAITGYLDRREDPITCDTAYGAQIHVTPPQIYSISGFQEAVSWTPYLFKYDGTTWQPVSHGSTFQQTAFNGSSGNSLLFLYGYGSMQNGFSVTDAGYYQVADYVTWNIYPNYYDFEWAGVHSFEGDPAYGAIFGENTYAPWCYFAPVGAAANAAPPAPPSLDAAPMAPPPDG